uniref:Uncharacterized protein n=1 Tax=Anguilla anguilla TaxID=7936 RepID=A0A0E9UEC2_ANGAN
MSILKTIFEVHVNFFTNLTAFMFMFK